MCMHGYPIARVLGLARTTASVEKIEESILFAQAEMERLQRLLRAENARRRCVCVSVCVCVRVCACPCVCVCVILRSQASSHLRCGRVLGRRLPQAMCKRPHFSVCVPRSLSVSDVRSAVPASLAHSILRPWAHQQGETSVGSSWLQEDRIGGEETSGNRAKSQKPGAIKHTQTQTQSCT